MISIEDSFEILSPEEWALYLGSDIFNDMYIDAASLGVNKNELLNIWAPRLGEMVFEHNNKVGALRYTYALCRHYYDKGIPDDPWWALSERGVQYMPNFSEEHRGRQFWYNYFANTFYLRISAIWDSVIEIINHYYGYNFLSDGRLREKVFEKLKNDKPELQNIFNNIKKDFRYKSANEFRTMAAHGAFDGEIHKTVKVEYTQRTDISEKDENINIMSEGEKNKIKKPKAMERISYGIGDYTNAETIMMNIEEYSKFTGVKIQEIVEYIMNGSGDKGGEYV